MAGYSHLELKYARPIATAILGDADFRGWLLRSTRHGGPTYQPVDAQLARGLRSATMRNPYWFNYWCGKDKRCVCREAPDKAGIETDILIFLDAESVPRLALHIEIKRPGEEFLEGQAESYPRRAACWANSCTRPGTVVQHGNSLTVLVCGRELARDPRSRHFDKVVFHEEVAARIPVYPEP
ncbi:MAG TPA: hypothetical protein VG889_04135 [Rhizomicrobium sp.]|nr:hypothetical protein [Rhizomicrobium sp.]